MKRVLIALMIACCTFLFISLGLLLTQKPEAKKNKSVLVFWSTEEIFLNNQGRELLHLRTWKTAKERNVTAFSLDSVPEEAKGAYARYYTPVRADEIIREGESHIPFDAYIACLARVLHVDVKAKVEQPWEEKDNLAFPYVLLPVSVELSDVKATMCSLDVHVRHLMYVVEGASPTTVAFFEDVASIFRFTQRLKVHHVTGMLGYANMVNAGLLDATQLSREEVPFFTVLNHSVRIPAATVRASLAKFYNGSTADAAIKEEESMRQEIQKEPNAHTPIRFPSALRSFENKTLVTTSPLLPDSIRYLPIFQLRERFQNLDGLLLFEDIDSFQFDVFAMTRFAMNTVGSMDENILHPPAVVKDWNDRRMSLGLQTRPPSEGYIDRPPSLKRYTQAKQVLSDRYDVSPSSFTEAHTWAKVLNHLERDALDFAYIKRKYGETVDDEIFAPYISFPFVPLDAWVLDLYRRLSWYKLVGSTRDYFFNTTISHKKKVNVKHAFAWIPISVWEAETRGVLFQVFGVAFTDLMETIFQKKELKPVRWQEEPVPSDEPSKAKEDV